MTGTGDQLPSDANKESSDSRYLPLSHCGVSAHQLLRPSKFEGHCPMIRHGCRMALMV
ncbi:MAG: hypothetical protein BECKG1743E_GA0114224_111421, partial [Candidatus Kentron sp. G]